MDRLVLFDIDNTLIKKSRGHHKAFSFAFKKVYGVEATIDAINYYGMTDRQIIREVLKTKGLNDQIIYSKIEECMEAMVEYFNKAIENEDIKALKGAKKLLKELEKHGVVIGVVTGNVEGIAKTKLKKAGLSSYFKVGAFGSDDESRAKLVKLAIRRAEKMFGLSSNIEAFVVGDTPRDMKAGKEAGVKTIGVATGFYSERELKEAGADFVLRSLEEKDKFIDIVLKSF